MKQESMSFLGKPYKRGSGVLKVYDKVWVHPTETSERKEKYEAQVVILGVDIVAELGTVMLEEGHFSIMRDYLFDRLEKIDNG